MDDRTAQFRVGVMILVTMVIAGILVVLFKDVPGLGRRTYNVHMKFAQAPGVSIDTPVRRSGLLVGRVSGVGFDDDGSVNITAAMDADVAVDRSEVPYIHRSLLGDSEVQFRPVQGQRMQRVPLGEDDVLQGQVEADPLRTLEELELEATLGTLRGAGDEVNKLARNLNNLLANNNEQLSRIVIKTEQALDSFQRTMEGLNQVVGDEQLRADLKQSIAGLPALLDETSAAVQNIRSVADTADRNLKNLEGLTQPLGERGEQIVSNIDSSVAQLDELLAQLSQFSTSLNSEEGSLGQLINRPDVYQQLNEAATNINHLTRELKPIVRDVRAFTDKIARHPEVLGARGAIQPSSGIK